MGAHTPEAAGDRRRRFADLHRAGHFVMPNAWDVGSARILAALDFPAIATTSSGLAASLGKHDQQLTLAELEAHVTSLVAAVEVPVSVDAENGYATDPAGVAETVERLAGCGAAGLSIEDYEPGAGIYPLGAAVARIEAAAERCRAGGLVLTARAENHLYGFGDLEDTIARLEAFRDAGADVVYAPGLTRAEDIRRVTDAVDCPINALLVPEAPSLAEMAEIGVRRFSTGGGLAFAAYGALARAAGELLDGTALTYHEGVLPPGLRDRAFDIADSL